MSQTTTKGIIGSLLTKNLPFAIYRLPGERYPILLVSTCPVREFSLGKLDGQKGFVAAPFESYKSRKAFLIEADLIAGNPEETERLAAFLRPFPRKKPRFYDNPVTVTRKATYLKQAEKLVRLMQKGEAGKVVLSRAIQRKLTAGFDFDRFFDRLQQDYPAAFTYLFSLPGEGLWAGATPETFLSLQAGFVETMALAGTQKQPVKAWQEKEKEEQAFVVGFVEEQIKKLGIEGYEKSETETLNAGQVAHLCTRFRLPAKAVGQKAGALASLLHPTPAVCGLPKEKAWQLIAETEGHRRGFYTGFIGPWQVRGHARLFVNLRCAAFSAEKMTLYTGGGLTAASVPEKEWQETEDKLQTLLSVVEKMRNFAP